MHPVYESKYSSYNVVILKELFKLQKELKGILVLREVNISGEGKAI